MHMVKPVRSISCSSLMIISGGLSFINITRDHELYVCKRKQIIAIVLRCCMFYKDAANTSSLLFTRQQLRPVVYNCFLNSVAHYNIRKKKNPPRLLSFCDAGILELSVAFVM